MENAFYFKPEGTFIFKVVSSPLALMLKQGKKWGRVFLILVFLTGIASAYQITTHRLGVNIELLTGVNLILLIFSLSFYHGHFFFTIRLMHPRLRTILRQTNLGGNLAPFLDYESAKAVYKIIKNSKKNPNRISSFSFAPILLNQSPIVNFTFYRLGLSAKLFSQEWRQLGQGKEKQSVSLESIIQAAAVKAAKANHQSIQLSDILAALARYDVFFTQVLLKHGLDADSFIHVVEWFDRIDQDSKRRRKFWTFNNLIRKGSLAVNWAAAYTLTIDRYSINWTKRAQLQSRHLEILGHQKELQQVENILSKSGFNNVLLVGQPGSGGKDIIQAFASKSFWGTTPSALSKKRVLELDISAIINEIPSAEEVGLTLEKCFQESLLASNVILVINNLENYLESTESGGVDISDTLSRYLQSSKFQVIAIASYRGLHQQIEQKPSFLNLFSKVEIEPLTANETLKLLEFRVPGFEQHYNQFILYPALKRIVSYSARYLQESPFPQKALDLLDEVLVYATRISRRDKIVWPKYVDAVISQKTQIPVGQMIASERETLIHLEDLLHQSIINQNEAIKDVASALRRSRTEVTAERNKPMGSFLFLGPTGVGKTETAKALARVYFGSEKRIIRMDMAEFQKVGDIKRFIGDEDHPGLLTSQVRENPFSLVLIDEIEKAHPDILNLFLTVLDEGYLTDSWGRQVSFADTVIIATSNAGASLIWKDIQKNQKLNLIKADLTNYLLSQNIFRPEFINRFNSLVIFQPLTPENLLAITQLKLKKLKDSLQKSHKIELVITQKLKEKISQLGYDPAFGARAMNRVIENKVENALASAILGKEIQKGDKIEINPETFKVVRLSSI